MPNAHTFFKHSWVVRPLQGVHSVADSCIVRSYNVFAKPDGAVVINDQCETIMKFDTKLNYIPRFWS